jgi:hypothetical protein
VPAHSTTTVALTVCPPTNRTPTAVPIEYDPGDLGIAAHTEVRALIRVGQVGQRGAHAHPVTTVDRQQPRTDCPGGVVIGHRLKPDRLERREPRRRHVGELRCPVAADRPALAVPRGFPVILVALEPDEVREQILKRPAGVSGRGPGVVIGWRASQRDHGVRRGAAPEQPPPGKLAGVPIRVGLGDIAPGRRRSPVQMRDGYAWRSENARPQ